VIGSRMGGGWLVPGTPSRLNACKPVMIGCLHACEIDWLACSRHGPAPLLSYLIQLARLRQPARRKREDFPHAWSLAQAALLHAGSQAQQYVQVTNQRTLHYLRQNFGQPAGIPCLERNLAAVH
jgi:hypothetical protein